MQHVLRRVEVQVGLGMLIAIVVAIAAWNWLRESQRAAVIEDYLAALCRPPGVDNFLRDAIACSRAAEERAPAFSRLPGEELIDALFDECMKYPNGVVADRRRAQLDAIVGGYPLSEAAFCRAKAREVFSAL